MSNRQSSEEAKAMAEQLRQLENHQKILLNKRSDMERKARTKRLIEHGAILESVFPETVSMTGKEVVAFLSGLAQRKA